MGNLPPLTHGNPRPSEFASHPAGGNLILATLAQRAMRGPELPNPQVRG